jgi:hypothetical protein
MSGLVIASFVVVLVATVGYGLWARQRRMRLRQEMRTPDDLYPMW